MQNRRRRQPGRLRGMSRPQPVWPVVVALLLATAIGIVDAVAPTDVAVIGAFAVGPCLAAAAASAPTTAAVGGYALLLGAGVSGMHGLWAAPKQVFSLAVVTMVTVISTLAARRLRTSQRAAEQGREDRDTLAAVVESSDDAIVLKSLDGTILAWNSGAQRMYGYSRDEAIGRHISLVMPSREAAELPSLLARVARGERVNHYDAQRIAKDGTVLDVSVNLAPVRDRRGTVVATSATARDITGRKQAEEVARKLQQRSAQNERLESLGQLAGGIAHDFNNILAVILNYTEFLTETVAGNPEATADLHHIRGAAERAQHLVRQLLVFARREPAHVEDLDLTTVIKTTRDLLARTIGENVDLITSVPPHALHIRGDHTQIERVLLNLVLNARDAMPEGGAIVIEAALIEVDAEHSRLQPPLRPGRYARLLVSDTGTGMTRDVAERVFEPFFTTKPKDKGVGLGLATVHGIISQAGGAIKIYSEPGIGTTVRMYLPTVERALATPAGPATAHPPRGHGQHILVVEDEDAVRDLVGRILQRHGYAVLCADRGPIALDLAREHHPDLLLTDVIMPEMSGRDLAHQMRQRDPHLPVVFMSGYSDGLLTAQHILQADTPLIQKPFTAADLLHTIHRVLNTPTTAPPRPTRR